ncbi:MAG: hypothetical protein ABI317_12370 [Gaiellales bacterium]
MPHSNFSDALQISHEGRRLTVEGPIALDDDDADLVALVVSAFVSQQPATRTAEPALGITCAGRFELPGDADEDVADAIHWSFEAHAHGGTFDEGWAFASADMLSQGADGGLETYTWSQWVWLRRA